MSDQKNFKVMELSEAIERPRVDNVFLRKGPRRPQQGSLALIGHHMIFSPLATSLNSPKGKEDRDELWVHCKSFFLLHSKDCQFVFVLCLNICVCLPTKSAYQSR